MIKVRYRYFSMSTTKNNNLSKQRKAALKRRTAMYSYDDVQISKAFSRGFRNNICLLYIHWGIMYVGRTSPLPSDRGGGEFPRENTIAYSKTYGGHTLCS